MTSHPDTEFKFEELQCRMSPYARLLSSWLSDTRRRSTGRPCIAGKP